VPLIVDYFLVNTIPVKQQNAPPQPLPSASNSAASVSPSTSVVQQAEVGAKGSNVNVGAIVGGVVGSIVGLLFIVVLVWWWVRRRSRWRQSDAFGGWTNPHPYIEPFVESGIATQGSDFQRPVTPYSMVSEKFVAKHSRGASSASSNFVVSTAFVRHQDSGVRNIAAEDVDVQRGEIVNIPPEYSSI
jgi:hypothetical protein